MKNYPQPAGRNLFVADGRVLSVWKAEQGGKQNVFYAQPAEREDGDVYLCNWTGHGENDSFNGWQVIEFGKDGQVKWHLDSPDRYGSISGIDVLED